MGGLIEYCRGAYGPFGARFGFSKRDNPGRALAMIGAVNRRERYKRFHDEMRECLGLEPMDWKD